MTTALDIAWLAGIIEGEGCIKTVGKSSPCIAVAMTDRDILERVGGLFRSGRVMDVKTTKRPGRDAKTVYCVRAYGVRAAAWLMTILPFLGERRSAKALQVLRAWKAGSRPSYRRRETNGVGLRPLSEWIADKARRTRRVKG